MESPGRRAVLAAVLTASIAAALILLGAVLAPRLLALRREAAETRTAVCLGAIRAALAAYAEKNGGRPPLELDDPAFLAVLAAGGAAFPAVKAETDQGLPETSLAHLGHPASSEAEVRPFIGEDGKVDPARLLDSGRWLYDRRAGKVIVDCTHAPAAARYLGSPIYNW